MRRSSFPGDQPNLDTLYNLWASQQKGRYWPQELVELNDCFYRARAQHDYLTVLDIDEMILPQKVDNWHQLLDRIEVWFFEDFVNFTINFDHLSVSKCPRVSTLDG